MEIKHVITELSGGAHVISWTGITSGDTCTPVQFVGGRDRTVEVTGTFGGGSISIKGAVNPKSDASFKTLSDLFANALVFSGEGIEAITELTSQIRPELTGGTGGTTAIDVHIIFGGSK